MHKWNGEANIVKGNYKISWNIFLTIFLCTFFILCIYCWSNSRVQRSRIYWYCFQLNWKLDLNVVLQFFLFYFIKKRKNSKHADEYLNCLSLKLCANCQIVYKDVKVLLENRKIFIIFAVIFLNISFEW